MNDMVYYCVYDTATGAVTNAGFCPRDHVQMQRRKGSEDVLVTSDTSSTLNLVRCKHEEIKLGYVVGHTTTIKDGQSKTVVSVGHARSIAQNATITPGKATT